MEVLWQFLSFWPEVMIDLFTRLERFEGVPHWLAYVLAGSIAPMLLMGCNDLANLFAENVPDPQGRLILIVQGVESLALISITFVAITYFPATIAHAISAAAANPLSATDSALYTLAGSSVIAIAAFRVRHLFE